MTEDDDGWVDGVPAGTCLWCGLVLTDDGMVLLAYNGEVCSVLTALGADHGHCNGFVADTNGEELRVCAVCFVLRQDHPDLPEPPLEAAVCVCGHPEDAHQHYRLGTDCSRPSCRCRRFRGPRSLVARLARRRVRRDLLDMLRVQGMPSDPQALG